MISRDDVLHAIVLRIGWCFFYLAVLYTKKGPYMLGFFFGLFHMEKNVYIMGIGIV
jgi:hypothetical protein